MLGFSELGKALSEGSRSGWQLIAPPVEENAVGLNVPADWAWAFLTEPAHRAAWDFGVVRASVGEGGVLLIERRLPLVGLFPERSRLLRPPADGAPGCIESELYNHRGMVRAYETRFTVTPERRFCRVDARVAGNISPFLLRRYFGGVLAAWLARSLARLREYCEARRKETL